MSDSAKQSGRGPYRVITCRRLSGAASEDRSGADDRQGSEDPAAGQRPAATST
ncbi:Uncharacterised protein [Mycobacteroides abscessus subsp. abscessus]|nr:Uncharacterised protein [Mycobacteroides abscessus subsp. abscessus]